MEKLTKSCHEETYPHRIFAARLITLYDLARSKKQLVDKLVAVLSLRPPSQTKRWLKSQQVRRMLKISPGTFQFLTGL
ncbi:DNA-binding protein [Segetibacter sp. 3557_3]|uniref:DNA-binding protein n=1 Tax=Segetibacter sp. 3557_3 TaxID=2547429 RepID=UPI001058E248|nr:DNA-binding protein [Segetibacter sp. 3557_3]TDH20059.1 DNA-binding protein [Segetibacter sp. 3557_3]